MPFNLDEYEPVEDRLRAFWSDHPDGRVLTDLVYTGADGYIVKAAAWRNGMAWERVSVGNGDWVRGEAIPAVAPPPDATGYAQEAVTERGVNATSALENCETSAIGRALANLGYAAKGKRPSREEMVKASGGSSSGESITPPASSSQRQQGTPPGDNVGEGTARSSLNAGGGEPRPGDAVRGNPAAPSPTTTSGKGAGEAGAAPEGYGEGPDGAVPSTTELATADDLANAAKHGLTPTKTKAIAASLGITVAKATDLTREQLAAVINRYLEMQAVKK